MTRERNRLGIDVGSVSVAVVEIDDCGEIVGSGCEPHHGRISETLRGLLSSFDLSRVGWVGKTSSTPDDVVADSVVDNNVAAMTSARHLHPGLRALLVVGGERFSLTRFDADGRYQDTRTNSSCAAGTGSFLDQQAETLGLADGAALAVEAGDASGEPPKIASRCAVFAKTDLIHAQQAGFGRESICDGLCRGLASIVADTLFSGEPVAEPVVLAGGVALNPAVRRHLSELCGVELHVDSESQLYGALGAALGLPADARLRDRALDLETLVVSQQKEREYFFPPLELDELEYPTFESAASYLYRPEHVERGGAVEVDIYPRVKPGSALDVFLGVDIGSTSSKAVLLSPGRKVVAGFYTRTSGRPIEAVQGILEAIWGWAHEHDLSLSIRGAGTTGSGRSLVGSVIGADLVVDEISAHARAAFELDPETDTIIEIGGQDAKFTTLRDGMVTSAVMNTVCAAGTGTFIEEQARRLNCPLREFPERVAGARAPLASDRCTVFMQRDVSHLITHGYDVSEVLAAVLHSVRENYLMKVAREGAIGERICFQGATAKNRALVAAFAQRLGKPIRVSQYCHLTGALGVGLMLAEAQPAGSRFRGVELFRRDIPISSEVCDLCKNHCKITTAEVMGEVAAYGFLCGRDYEVDRYVSGNRSGFDLLKVRKKVFHQTERAEPHVDVTVGLPAALYMVEDLPFWQDFFARLGVRTVTSQSCPDPVVRGKKLARAEFCAPMAAYHGHVAYLLDRVDFVFAPIVLEASNSSDEVRRQNCYYSQYASSLTGMMAARGDAKILRPLITKGIADFQTKARLHAALRPVLGDVSFGRVAEAYTEAAELHGRRQQALRELLVDEVEYAVDVGVVLLGRPYACLDPRMNKGIPEILGRMGIKAFFQDMLTYYEEDVRDIEELLRQMHWKYAPKILGSAEVVAKTPGLYPVLVSCFKCAPDSCTIEFFRRIMDRHGKPYLILELDDHDSAIGYETRLEAAVRAFRNHHTATRPSIAPRILPVNPRPLRQLDGRKLFLPNFDKWSGDLVAAGLRHEGIDAELLYEDDLTIQKSLRHNTGQCIPLNAIVQGFVDAVTAQGLDPAETALWTIDSQIACNIGMWVGVIKSLLEAQGNGFENAAVYIGDLSHINISIKAATTTYHAYQFGGMLRRMVCALRPYERTPGTTDRVAAESIDVLREAFENDRAKLGALEEVIEKFLAIDTHTRGGRPKVAIFGDLYVRDNEVMSHDLIRFIEQHGGEVITTPYTEYAKVIADAYFAKWLREGKVAEVVVNKSVLAGMKMLERKYQAQFERVLGPTPTNELHRPHKEILAQFEMTTHHTGESLDNLLKIFHILETDPDVSLFVQANPAFCCPSLVTEAMAGRIEEVTGVPVVTLTYDGTSSSPNDALIPHLKFPRRKRRGRVAG